MTTVTDQLSHLEASGLIKLAQTAPELEYLFRHALVQDVAYQSLLMTDRRHFHRTVGETLELLYPERQGEQAAALGHHFELAEENARALPYFIQAADNAASNYANGEAIVLYGKAVAIARKIVADVADTVLLHLCQKLGRTLEITGDYDRALTHYQEMEQVALACEDKRLELTAVIGQTTLYTTPTAVTDTEMGAICAQRAIALAKELDDQPAHLRVLWNLLNLYAFNNDMEKAFAVGEEALIVAKKQGLRESEAYIVNDLSRQYAFASNLRRAEPLAKRARQLWTELDNLSMLTDSLANSGSIANERGEFQRALDFANKGIQIGISTNNLHAQAYNLVTAASPYFYLGYIEKSIEALTSCLKHAQQINFVPIQVFALSYMAHVYLNCGDVARSLAIAQAAYTLAEEEFPRALMAGMSVLALAEAVSGMNAETKLLIAKAKVDSRYQSQALFSPWVMEAETRILLQEGDATAAVAASCLMQTTLERFGSLVTMPTALLLQGEALAALGRWDEARQAAEQGMKTAVSTHNLYLHWQLAAFQAKLQTKQGNREEAETLRRKAKTIINEIAANCPPDLRETFLGMAAVTAVLHPT